MRALRVAGLGTDGGTVILEAVPQRPGERREQFTLPVDDNLHAAVRGDLPHLDKIEIEPENQLRPREIQDSDPGRRLRRAARRRQLARPANGSSGSPTPSAGTIPHCTAGPAAPTQYAPTGPMCAPWRRLSLRLSASGATTSAQ